MDNIEVEGALDVNAFFQTLAAILSRKYGVDISVTVTSSGQDRQPDTQTKNRKLTGRRISA